MAALQTTKVQVACRSAGGRTAVVSRPTLPSRKPVLVQARSDAKVVERMGLAATVATTSMLVVSSAQAVTEVAQLADGDTRVGAIAALFVPALGWVAFNILSPLLSQFDDMAKKNKAVIGAVGLGAAATLLVAENADAATEVAQLAGADNRVLAIAALFVPALGWVAFNALQPLMTQVDGMAKKKKAVIGGVGLGAAATLLVAENASAAAEVAQLAAADNRIGAIAALFVPALGWVAFNILSPLLSQFDDMSKKNKGVIGAVGLGAAATLLVAENANAAVEVAQLAGGDSRVGAIASLFVPALGWVAFNALSPLKSQLDDMSSRNSKSIAVGTGLGAAATLMMAEQAQAASVYADIAGVDNRASIILALFVPALGWVAFNALQPLLTQMDSMAKKN